MKVFQIIIIAVLSLTGLNLIAHANENGKQKIDYRAFDSIKIDNRITMESILPLTEVYAPLYEAFGEPDSLVRHPRDRDLGFAGPVDIYYKGLNIEFLDPDDGLTFGHIEITDASHPVSVHGKELRVGDSLEKVQKLFPEAFKDDFKLASTEAVVIQAEHQIGDLEIGFDKSSNTISNINLKRF